MFLYVTQLHVLYFLKANCGENNVSSLKKKITLFTVQLNQALLRWLHQYVNSKCISHYIPC